MLIIELLLIELIGLWMLWMYSIYLSSKKEKKKFTEEDFGKEVEELDLIDFRNFIVSKGKNWFLLNEKPIKEILVRKYGKEQAHYNYIFLLKTFAFWIDKKIQKGEW